MNRYSYVCGYYGSTAHCRAMAALQFLGPIHSRQDALDEELARRRAATFTRDNTNTE
jgi:hypothetical protein